MEDSNPTTDDVDKVIAEIDAKTKQKEDAPKNVAVETNGHGLPETKSDNDSSEKKEPSERVKEGQRWNNRDRNGKPGRGGFKKNYRDNYKSDLTAQAESSDPIAIRKQVEFYFSDSNLLQDNFLYKQVQGHDNLPIPISTIHSFKRMRHFQPFSAIVDALKESKTLNVVGEKNDHIQRKTPLPEDFKDKEINEVKKVFEDEAMKRSVYVKGFGEEQASTQFDIEAFFAEYGPTNSVRLRRHKDKMFKGSVFVEFDSEESQKKFLELDPKPNWKGQDLMIKSKKQYCDEKVEDIKSGHVRAQTGEGGRFRGGDDRDDRDWKTRRAEDQRNGHRGGKVGGGRGFGSHKGGHGRGGRHGRDRDDHRRRDRDRDADEPYTTSPLLRHRDTLLTSFNHSNVPKVATTAESDHEDSKATVKDILPPSPREKEEAQATAGAAVSQPRPESASKKRARDDDAGVPDDRSAKKVDSKTEAAATTARHEIKDVSKKRAREEDGEPAEGQAVKRVDTGGASESL
ncbi:MAG: hypothetical protein Q9184_001838 [Pyrenodesmia sp. 2 TL-2023]